MGQPGGGGEREIKGEFVVNSRMGAETDTLSSGTTGSKVLSSLVLLDIY